MNVFISGIAGFLGSHLADKLISLGYTVSGCDNLIGGYLDNVPKKAKFYQEDCNDFLLMKRITKNIDIVLVMIGSSNSIYDSIVLRYSEWMMGLH